MLLNGRSHGVQSPLWGECREREREEREKREKWQEGELASQLYAFGIPF